jgi:hypothetical protein
MKRKYMTVEELLNRYRAGEREFTGVTFTYLVRLIMPILTNGKEYLTTS